MFSNERTEQVKKMVELAKQGKTATEIANELQLSVNQITYAIGRLEQFGLKVELATKNMRNKVDWQAVADSYGNGKGAPEEVKE